MYDILGDKPFEINIYSNIFSKIHSLYADTRV